MYIKKPKSKKIYYSDAVKKLHKSFKKECIICNGKTMLCIYHKDLDKTNNDISNLECICYMCHPNKKNNVIPPWLR